MLTLLLILPLIAALVLLPMPRNWHKAHQAVSVVTAAVQVVLAGMVWHQFDERQSGFQLIEQAQWFQLPLGSLGVVSIQYLLGVDGLALAMVLLSALVLLLGALTSTIKEHSKGYHALYLLLSSAVMGTFLAVDQFLFFLCFEFMLLPMYFLVGIWGGPRRTYAAIKFFLYTLLGSVMILIAIIGFASAHLDLKATAARYAELTGKPATETEVTALLAANALPEATWVRSFSLADMQQEASTVPTSLLAKGKQTAIGGLDARTLAFLLLLIGFAIKLPSVPVHTWLPDAHVEAPTAVSVVLAGVLLKIGAFGLLRLAFGLLPEVAWAYKDWLAALGVISLIYAALIALAQDDLKKMVAYSSVSHMGFVLLGMASHTAIGYTGAIYQLMSHGVISAFLFMAVGVLQYQTGSRSITHFQGLAVAMPRYTALVGVGFFAALGLPLFSGFIAEVFVLMGSVEAATHQHMSWTWVVLALLSLVITAGYFLWAFKRMFLGKLWQQADLKPVHDITHGQVLLLAVPLSLALFLGIWPRPMLELIETFVLQLPGFGV